MSRRKNEEKKPCDHGNNYGLHGQVVCVCGHVIRRMTPEERANDWTWRGVIDEKAMEKVQILIANSNLKKD